MAEVYLSGTASDQPAHAADLPHYRILLFLPAGFEDAEVAAVLDILGWTAYRPSIATVEVVKTGLQPAVSGAFGLRFDVDVPFGQVNVADYDALVIPGGFHNFGFDEMYSEPVYQLIRQARHAGLPIATMCVGILPVACAGVLEGGRATTYELSRRHDNAAVLREHGCQHTGNDVEEWEGIISCSGPAFSETVVMRLLELVAGKSAADEVARYRAGLI